MTAKNHVSSGVFVVAFVMLASRGLTAAGEDVCFGDKSMGGGVGKYRGLAKEVCASGPSTLVSHYIKARKVSFEEPDPAVVEKLRTNVVFTIPATAYRTVNFQYPAKKIVFTKKRTRDVVLTIPVTAKEVALSNDFGAVKSAFEGRAEVSVDELRIALDPAKGEYEFNLTLDTDQPEWAIWTDQWKSGYFKKLTKPVGQ